MEQSSQSPPAAGAARPRELPRRLVPWGLFTVAFAAASYFWVDRPMALFVDAAAPHWLRETAGIVTQVGYAAWSLIPLGLLFIFCFFTRRPRAARGSLVAFVGVAASGLVVVLVKVPAGRARPKLFLGPDHLYGFFGWHTHYDYISFPSGHAATIAALAAALCLILPRHRPAWVALGILAASTRVLTGSHYPGDVAVGAYLGVAATLIAHSLLPQHISRAAPRQKQEG